MIKLVGTLVVVLAGCVAFADGPCDEVTCAAGERVVSFSDGGEAMCRCVSDQVAMVETEPNTELAEVGEGYEDAGQKE